MALYVCHKCCVRISVTNCHPNQQLILIPQQLNDSFSTLASVFVDDSLHGHSDRLHACSDRLQSASLSDHQPGNDTSQVQDDTYDLHDTYDTNESHRSVIL